MTREDTKIIFSNVAELALFSDLFVERLEEALGSVLDGGIGDDHVGALFVEIVRQPSPNMVLRTYLTFFVCRYQPWSLLTRLTSHGIQQHSLT
jgi:hypothetical protein